MPAYKINKGFVVQKLDDKTVIFDGEESVLYEFNGVAFYIFKKIKAGWDEEKISTSLTKTYQVKENRVIQDVNVFISDLKKKKIIASLKSKK